ncbi:MAG: hypothetical protein AAGF24_09070 [Cyanobacteria bacterium P01_H01_bin.121]
MRLTRANVAQALEEKGFAMEYSPRSWQHCNKYNGRIDDLDPNQRTKGGYWLEAYYYVTNGQAFSYHSTLREIAESYAL